MGLRKRLYDALQLDRGPLGDVTSLALIEKEQQATAEFLVKADKGIVSGIEVARVVFELVDPKIRFTPLLQDGDEVNRGDVFATITGPARSLLTGERAELISALINTPDRILLDNMNNEETREVVRIRDKFTKHARVKIPLEASGNMTLERIKEVEQTGAEYISVGSLTHSVKAFDISLHIKVFINKHDEKSTTSHSTRNLRTVQD